MVVDGSDLVIESAGQRVLIDTDDLHTDPVKDPNGPRLGAGDEITVHGKVADIDKKRVKIAASSIDLVARNSMPQTVR